MASDPIQAPRVVDTLDRALRDITGARSYNAWLFDRAGAQLGQRILDIGAGLGTFTALARENSRRCVVAVEPETEFARLLRKRFESDDCVEVVEGAVDAVADRNFDSVICFNVLEHVEDDAAALRAFAERLVPGGRVFLLVPAHPRLYGGFDRAAGHLRRYSKRPLERLLTTAGFEVETLRHVNPVGALGWLVRVRLRSSPEWPASSFRAFDRLVPVLRPLDRMRLPFGLSLWAVARRPTGAEASAR
jgi:SAM-dependent methyltransferase